jgi:Endonuclease NucS C-terminal domain
MTSLWRIDSNGLVAVDSGKLDAESQIEDWIERDPSLLDPDLLIIGRQVKTAHSGPIDLLGLTSNGSISIIELKRNKTPREVVAQILDYASWVVTLETADIYDIANEYLQSKNLGNLPDAFRKEFEQPIPEQLNETHNMLIVASELDESSKRIVQYLSQSHRIAINTAFFKIFSDGDKRYLAADWLMEQEIVEERVKARKKAPWRGDWYGIFDDQHSREDMTKYGFFSAGGGRTYSRPLERLNDGDPLYVYRKGAGYVGFGLVKGKSVRARGFEVSQKPLFDLPLKAASIIKRHEDDQDRAEYLVPVEWIKTFPVDEAKTFPNIFRNQNVICKLTEPATLDFLYAEFGRIQRSGLSA